MVHGVREGLVLLGVKMLRQEALAEQIHDTVCILRRFLEYRSYKLVYVVQLNVPLEDRLSLACEVGSAWSLIVGLSHREDAIFISAKHID